MDVTIRKLQAVPGPKRAAPVPHHGSAPRGFANVDRTGRLRSRLGRLLHDEEKLREFVKKALPGVREHEAAVHAMRLVLRGFSIPAAARAAGVTPPTVSGWWNSYEAFVKAWLEGERDRRS